MKKILAFFEGHVLGAAAQKLDMAVEQTLDDIMLFERTSERM